MSAEVNACVTALEWGIPSSDTVLTLERKARRLSRFLDPERNVGKPLRIGICFY